MGDHGARRRADVERDFCPVEQPDPLSARAAEIGRDLGEIGTILAALALHPPDVGRE